MASSSGLIIIYLVCFVICNGAFIRKVYGFEQENESSSVDQDDIEALKKFFKVSMSRLEHRLKSSYEGQIQEVKKQIQILKTELLDLQEKTEQDAYQVTKALKHIGKHSKTNAKIVSASTNLDLLLDRLAKLLLLNLFGVGSWVILLQDLKR